MRFVSTRGGAPAVTLSQAIAAGLAPDGGLYVPDTLPSLSPADFADCVTLPQIAATLLRPFFAGDALAPELDAICDEAFDVPAPLRPLGDDTHLLELFHGPTAAFKDFGARFLAACLTRLRAGAQTPLTIIVATSGDTGAAVGGAFHRAPGLRVVILYPDGRVSPRQAHQLGAFGDNVRALRVAGSFDDCQALVKRALGDTALQARVALSSANSISLGRLLPQMSYYAKAALEHRRAHGGVLNFAIPTGNLGNAMACILARRIGLPIGKVLLATNANDVLPQFFDGAPYTPRASVATLANAMDVGAPSNFERLRWLTPDDNALRAGLRAIAVDDDAIARTIQDVWDAHFFAICPHTATAVHALQRERAAGRAHGIWAVAATAHPAKFDTIVEPLVGARVPPPPALAALLSRPASATAMPADDATFVQELLRG
ncbi:threonine synthase [Chiayiivirga flava]|uniref:Threonine synthase n=1 Tax=Chiayiivirga flava TaxID=659595 RepID=A0A7W8FZW8_9GAMM|nr:threonine synthase [Chiayiivirga flava]MBB5208566.1 threonine synthase [Chiayiivirga flava]